MYRAAAGNATILRQSSTRRRESCPLISATARQMQSMQDFANIWWVGDRTDGGLVAICLKNALSTSGLSLQTTKDGKGQLAVTLAGHYSIKEQKTVPMVFYVQEGEEDA